MVFILILILILIWIIPLVRILSQKLAFVLQKMSNKKNAYLSSIFSGSLLSIAVLGPTIDSNSYVIMIPMFGSFVLRGLNILLLLTEPKKAINWIKVLLDCISASSIMLAAFAGVGSMTDVVKAETSSKELLYSNIYLYVSIIRILVVLLEIINGTRIELSKLNKKEKMIE